VPFSSMRDGWMAPAQAVTCLLKRLPRVDVYVHRHTV
jgi:hypothetical protein